MPVNWKSPEMKDRLIAALFASLGTKVDYKAVAHYFGPDATNYTVEYQMRAFRAMAKELEKEYGAYGGANGKAAHTAKKSSTNASNKNGVHTGRVTKATGNNTKKRSTLNEAQLKALNGEFDEVTNADTIDVKDELRDEYDEIWRDDDDFDAIA